MINPPHGDIEIELAERFVLHNGITIQYPYELITVFAN
jgi:hypothetical protein